jgi:hypothetical protein
MFAPPAGVVTARVDPDTGLRAGDGQSGIADFFYQEFQPPDNSVASAVMGGDNPPEEVRNQLF